MKRTLLALALLALIAAPAHAAFDWKPAAVAAAGQLADFGVTHHQINAPRLHCSEANPLFGPHPSTATLLLPKLAAIGAATLVTAAGAHASSKAGRWLAKGTAYAVGALGGGLAGKNLRTCGW